MKCFTLPWVAVYVMGGYRWVITDNSRLNFNGWFFSFGGAVYIRQIIQDTRYYRAKLKYKKELKKINLNEE